MQKRIFKVWSLFWRGFLFFHFLFFYFFTYLFIFIFLFFHFFYFYFFIFYFFIIFLFFLFFIFYFFCFLFFLFFIFLFFIFFDDVITRPTHPSLFLSCLPPPTPLRFFSSLPCRPFSHPCRCFPTLFRRFSEDDVIFVKLGRYGPMTSA